MKFKTLHILFLLLLVNTAFSQKDTLLFMNGRIMTGEILEENKYEVNFREFNNRGTKDIKLDKYRIFASYSKLGKENIYYEYDTLLGNFLSVKDMKFFVYGEKDAFYGHKTPFATVLGLMVGATSGYLMHNDKNFVYVVTPFVLTLGSIPFNIRVNKNHISNKAYLNENEYLLGYERIARGQRVQNTLKSSLIGMGVGFLVSVIVNSGSK